MTPQNSRNAPFRSGIVTAMSASRASPSSARSATNRDRKSTRLNSSHLVISYAVFCLKKKKPQLISTSVLRKPLLQPHNVYDYPLREWPKTFNQDGSWHNTNRRPKIQARKQQ